MGCFSCLVIETFLHSFSLIDSNAFLDHNKDCITLFPITRGRDQKPFFFSPILIHIYFKLNNYILDIYDITDVCSTLLHVHGYLKMTIVIFCLVRVMYV